MAVCASPKLFAAYHVFHRLLVPRHSPCALSCLTSHNTLYCFSENIAFSLECFVVAIQLLLHLKIENFVFSIDSIFALLVFSFQGASCFEGLILQNRTMNIFHNLASKMSAKNHSYNFVVLMCLLRKLTLQFIVVLPCKQCIPTKISS